MILMKSFFIIKGLLAARAKFDDVVIDKFGSKFFFSKACSCVHNVLLGYSCH